MMVSGLGWLNGLKTGFALKPMCAFYPGNNGLPNWPKRSFTPNLFCLSIVQSIPLPDRSA
jgi:hypothetical protein